MPTIEQILAAEFARELNAELTAEQLAIVRERNATPAYTAACASHDFCDANMPMVTAFIRVYAAYPKPDSEYDSRVINEAWNIARAAGFDVDLIRAAN